MRIRKRLSILGIAGLLMLTACGANADDKSDKAAAGEPVKIKVGVIGIMLDAPYYTAVKQGFFKDVGLEPEAVTIQQSPTMITSVLNGEIDFGLVAIATALISLEKQIPISIVSGNDNWVGPEDADKDTTAVLVRKGSKITDVAGLRGKTVGINALQSQSYLITAATFDKYGVKPDDVKYVEIPFPAMLASLDKGVVDAVVIGEPFLSQGLAAGSVDLASPAAEALPGSPDTAFVASKQKIKDQPDVVKKFNEAIKRGAEYASAHQDETRAIAAEFTKIDPATLKEIRLPNFDATINEANLRRFAELMFTYGLVKAKIADPSAVLAKP